LDKPGGCRPHNVVAELTNHATRAPIHVVGVPSNIDQNNLSRTGRKRRSRGQ
jgi:hypothetical protein